MRVVFLDPGEHEVQDFRLIVRALLRGLHDPGISIADIEVRGVPQRLRPAADLPEVCAGRRLPPDDACARLHPCPGPCLHPCSPVHQLKFFISLLICYYYSRETGESKHMFY